jgi:5-methylcytosine-specific restriction enzyme subunit McrC
MTIELEAWAEERVALTAAQAAAVGRSGLARVLLDEPPDRWRLATEARVGVVRGDDWELRVRPRLAIPQLMFLLSYAADPHGWREVGPAFAADEDLFAAVAAAFALHAERALAPVPLRGYVSVEERSTTLRGRLRVADQIARWAAQPILLEIAHDDFTDDVPENRLLRGAAELLLRLPLLAAPARQRLLRVRATLEQVAPTPPGPAVRAPAPTRLNAGYGAALALAELILRGCSISTRAGAVTGVAFSFDMNKVFEDFLTRVLRTALERHGGRLDAQCAVHLDRARRIRLVPDLTWRAGGAVRAVVDAKYKRLADRRFPNADAYQMLAYCTALGLERGWLVYAKDAGEADRDHVVARLGTVLHVRAIDVERSPEEVLAAVDELAGAIAASAPL